MVSGLLAGLVWSMCAGGLRSIAQSDSNEVRASPSGGAQVGFHYQNKQLQPAVYSFVIDESGAGQFHSEPADTPVVDTTSYSPLAQPQDRPVQLSKPVVEQIFSVARGQKLFAIACEDRKDKIAFQGTKQLSYQGPEGSGACTYNWSKSTSIEKVTFTFESIAYTLEEGRRLAVQHKHDRLALDAELGLLLDAVKEGRALEVQTIEPVLREIVEDDSVMERARSRARKLLESGNTTASLR